MYVWRNYYWFFFTAIGIFLCNLPNCKRSLLDKAPPLKIGSTFKVGVNHSSLSLFLEGIPLGNSEADRQLLEAAKAGDVETVKVRYDLMFFC